MTQPKGFTLRLFAAAEALPTTNPVRKLALASISTDTPVVVVAERMGVSRATVYNWFTGRTHPRAAMEIRISEVTEEILQKRPSSLSVQANQPA